MYFLTDVLLEESGRLGMENAGKQLAGVWKVSGIQTLYVY